MKRRRIALGTSFMKPQSQCDTKNSRDALKPSVTNLNQDQLKQFLSTPEGQNLKSQLIVEKSDQILEVLLLKIQKQDPNDLAQKWILNLALQETMEVIQKHEELVKNQN